MTRPARYTASQRAHVQAHQREAKATRLICSATPRSVEVLEHFSFLAAQLRKWGAPGGGGCELVRAQPRTRAGGRGTWVLFLPRGDVYVAALISALSSEACAALHRARLAAAGGRGARHKRPCVQPRHRRARRRARSSSAASDGRHARAVYVEWAAPIYPGRLPGRAPARCRRRPATAPAERHGDRTGTA